MSEHDPEVGKPYEGTCIGYQGALAHLNGKTVTGPFDGHGLFGRSFLLTGDGNWWTVDTDSLRALSDES